MVSEKRARPRVLTQTAIQTIHAEKTASGKNPGTEAGSTLSVAGGRRSDMVVRSTAIREQEATAASKSSTARQWEGRDLFATRRYDYR